MNDKPVANPLIVLREEFDDWAILFDPDTGNAFGLNPTGVFVWKLLDGDHSLEDISKKLRDNADGVPEEVQPASASLLPSPLLHASPLPSGKKARHDPHSPGVRGLTPSSDKKEAPIKSTGAFVLQCSG